MSRAVTADHIMFNECISKFRPEKIEISSVEKGLTGYLLLDFNLTHTLQFKYFTIEPSIEVRLPGAYAAYISPVSLPKWFDSDHNTHLFTIGLASVISFALRRPVKAPRDGYITRREHLDENSLVELAIQFPILTAGPGAHDTRLSEESSTNMYENLQKTINIIYDIPYEIYNIAMQSIRLFHLSQMNKRDDFGLSYFLLVSSIEPIAAKAIRRKTVAYKHPKEDAWKERAKSDKDLEELLQAYKQERGKSQYLSKRLVEFIMKYCPPEQWVDLEHPRGNLVSYLEGLTGRKDDWLIKKQWDEKYPEDLSEDEIKKLLTDLYIHRSKFTHEGKNPPHQIPESHNRFFDIQTVVINKDEDFWVENIVLPNFQLVSFMANRSIMNYLKEV